MSALRDDPVPRLLLTVTDERCSWCRRLRVRAYASAGLRAELNGQGIEGTYCLSKRCPRALAALGPLGALAKVLEKL